MLGWLAADCTARLDPGDMCASGSLDGENSMSDSDYPPEPWYLGGSMEVSALLVPVSVLPASFRLPDGRQPIRLGDRVVVGVAAVEYHSGGVLQYNELLVAVPSFGRGGLRITIPQIWVDSPTSLRGGRELWGIPKQLADFGWNCAHKDIDFGMRLDNSPVATFSARPGGRMLPGVRQFGLPILQELGGKVKLSRNRVISRVFSQHAKWTFAQDGPLAYLAGMRPVLSFSLRDASIIFGMDPTRTKRTTQS